MTPAAIRMLAELGLTASQIADVAEANETRSSGAERQARYRARKRDVTRDVTETLSPSPETKSAPTPPEKTQPSPPNPPPLKPPALAEPLSPVVADGDSFEEAWKVYPHVRGRSSKKESLAAWRRIKDRRGMIDAIRRYRAEGREPKQECGAPAFERWLRKEQYLDWLTATVHRLPVPPPSPDLIDRRLLHYRETGEWRDHWGDRPADIALMG